MTTPTINNVIPLGFFQHGDTFVTAYRVRRHDRPAEFGLAIINSGDNSHSIMTASYAPTITVPDPINFFQHTNDDNGPLLGGCVIDAMHHPELTGLTCHHEAIAIRKKFAEAAGRGDHEFGESCVNKALAYFAPKMNPYKPEVAAHTNDEVRRMDAKLDDALVRFQNARHELKARHREVAVRENAGPESPGYALHLNNARAIHSTAVGDYEDASKALRDIARDLESNAYQIG